MASLKLMKVILLALSASVFTSVILSTASSLAQNNKTEMRESVSNRLTIASGKQVSTIGKYKSAEANYPLKSQFREEIAEVRDIYAIELGNPQTMEERFRAVMSWADRHGYAAAFPNFHQANTGSGVVYGTVLFKEGAVEVRDISAAELGNPRTMEERFRAVMSWADKHGYAAAFPNFHQANGRHGVVYGTVLIKK